ncbi:proline-specific peptidase [Epithele typhae]|uniref:proline-specific peptidase n=1 Tax=Epithele typhae TaxID=378194 RepID=UPI002008A5AB|nr:proline-specific peptidase [Epithele typhae]KAH9945098.1 proline-specific peptidase [Epithele typhae]
MEGECVFTVPGVEKTCKTWYKVFGDLKCGKTPLVVLHGGPGAAHNYVLSIADLVQTHGIPVVMYDQLGCGKSTHLQEKNGDTGFWIEQLFVDELHNLLDHLGIHGNYDVLGQSWGGMLGSRFATQRPKGLRRLVLANSLASMALWVESANKLRLDLPADVQETLTKHEKDGTTDSKEYHKAMDVFYAKYVCRVSPVPRDVAASPAQLEQDPTVYYTMNGPSEFHITGSLKTWSIIPELPKINVPTLVLNGRYDEAQDSVVQPFFQHISSKVWWFTFANSSHMPHYEERELFMQRVGDFLSMDM